MKMEYFEFRIMQLISEQLYLTPYTMERVKWKRLFGFVTKLETLIRRMPAFT